MEIQTRDCENNSFMVRELVPGGFAVTQSVNIHVSHAFKKPEDSLRICRIIQ
jgi:hypothetical protein